MNTFISLSFFINITFPVLNLIAIDIDNYWLFDLVFVNFAWHMQHYTYSNLLALRKVHKATGKKYEFD